MRILRWTLVGLGCLCSAAPAASAPVKPYVIGGGGFYTNSCTGCNSEWKFGFGGGVGGAWMMGSQTWFAELRYHTVSTSGVTIAWMPRSGSGPRPLIAGRRRTVCVPGWLDTRKRAVNQPT